MIDETLLFTAIISTVLSLGLFYVTWRYLKVPMDCWFDSNSSTLHISSNNQFDFDIKTSNVFGSSIITYGTSTDFNHVNTLNNYYSNFKTLENSKSNG